jgi:hypothetical protein
MMYRTTFFDFMKMTSSKEVYSGIPNAEARRCLEAIHPAPFSPVINLSNLPALPFQPVPSTQASRPMTVRLRGYRITAPNQKVIQISNPGFTPLY